MYIYIFCIVQSDHVRSNNHKMPPGIDLKYAGVNQSRQWSQALVKMSSKTIHRNIPITTLQGTSLTTLMHSAWNNTDIQQTVCTHPTQNSKLTSEPFRASGILIRNIGPRRRSNLILFFVLCSQRNQAAGLVEVHQTWQIESSVHFFLTSGAAKPVV